MAVIALTPVKVVYNTVTVSDLTASHTDGVTVVVPASDEKTMIVVYNSSADTAYDVTIKAPVNKLYAGSLVDKVVEVGFGKVAMIQVETAKFVDKVSNKITFDVENAALLFSTFYND